MKCESIINNFLIDYLAGHLSTGRRIQFELHLLVCIGCRRYLDSYKETIRLAKSTAQTQPDNPVPQELIDAILSVCQSQP